MKPTTYGISFALSVIMLVFSLEMYSYGSAHAYLDPASGSFLLQSILGAVVASLVSLKLFWARFLGVFDRLRGSGEDPAGSPGEDD